LDQHARYSFTDIIFDLANGSGTILIRATYLLAEDTQAPPFFPLTNGFNFFTVVASDMPPLNSIEIEGETSGDVFGALEDVRFSACAKFPNPPARQSCLLASVA